MSGEAAWRRWSGAGRGTGSGGPQPRPDQPGPAASGGRGGADPGGPGQHGGPPRRIALTRRAAVLASAVCAVALPLAYPLREYAVQRGEIDTLREQSAVANRQVAELTEQYRRWQDLAYVRAQARQRLHYVMPGETPYVVIRGGR